MDDTTKELLHKLLLGAMVGGGTYGGLQLSKEIVQALKGPVEPNNVLKINIPKERLNKVSSANVVLHKTAEDEGLMHHYLGGAATMTGHLASPVVGFGAGFYGLSKLYNALKEKQLKDEIDSAENRYLTTLQKVKEKTAEVFNAPTPKTDELLINALQEKVATSLVQIGGDQSQSELAKKISELIEAAKHWPDQFAHWAVGNPVAQLPAAAMMAGTLLSGAGTYHLLNRNDRIREENKKSNNFPTEVSINPV